MFPKPKRVKNTKYKEWIETLPCCISGYKHPTEKNDPHHCPKKGYGSVSMKTDDTRCIPLRHDLHVELHNIGRETFAKKYGIHYEAVIEFLNKLWEEKCG